MYGNGRGSVVVVVGIVVVSIFAQPVSAVDVLDSKEEETFRLLLLTCLVLLLVDPPRCFPLTLSDRLPSFPLLEETEEELGELGV